MWGPWTSRSTPAIHPQLSIGRAFSPCGRAKPKFTAAFPNDQALFPFWYGSCLGGFVQWGADLFGQHFQPDVAILHLVTVGFQADGAGFGKFEGGFEHLAVA